MFWLVIKSKKIRFGNFILHENVKVCIWNTQTQCSDLVPYPVDSTSKYLESILSRKCLPSWPIWDVNWW